MAERDYASLNYVCEQYGVPAVKGGRVTYADDDQGSTGTILGGSAQSAHVLVLSMASRSRFRAIRWAIVARLTVTR